MATIRNSDSVQELIRSAGIQTASDQVPTNLSQVVGTLECNNLLVSPVNVMKSVNATGTIYTTAADEDFYLTSCMISGAKAVGDSGSALLLTVTVNGANPSVIVIQGITLTAQQDQVVANLSRPIKLDRGGTIQLSATGTWTATRACIQGVSLKNQK